MNPGLTSERVFVALKQQILSGAVPPGEKLEPAVFAEQLNSSITPVRDALHRLIGERLVEARASEGFHLPLVTEPSLRDRYAWNAELIRLIAKGWRTARPTARADELSADIGRATPMFFELFASGAANREHAHHIAQSNDQLATARAAEARVLGDLEAELRTMAVAFDRAPASELLKLVAAYHRRRLRATPTIVRALYG